MTSVKIAVLSIITVLIAWNSNAQDIDYAKKTIEILSSAKMHGRGYVKNGDFKAARFIAKEFKSIGLEPLSDNYFQGFDFSVNSFPSKMKFKVDDNLLSPGYDFLIDPASPGIKGSFPVCILKEYSNLNALVNRLNSRKESFVLVVDWFSLSDLSEEKRNELKANLARFQRNGFSKLSAIVEYSTEKLTWTGSTGLLSLPRFTVKASEFGLNENSTLTFNVKNKFRKEYHSNNIIGYLPGENTDSVIVLSAHYDHLGRMGKGCYFPGANDNASGVAMLLNQARELKHVKRPYSILFIAFAAEEIGLLGSGYYVAHPLIELDRIKFLLNLDLAGTGDEGIQIVNGSIHTALFSKIQTLNRRDNLLTKVKTRGAACNSDHCHFHERNVPSFFIYTLGGIKAYHDVYDRYETLPLTAYDGYFKLLNRFILSL